jgi:CubicO group peptidase (beta-lactamase class C family)
MATTTVEGPESRPLWVSTRRGGAVATSLAAILVAVLVSAWVGPQPMHLGFQTAGDTRLADRVRAILGADGTAGSTAGFHGLAVVVVSPGQTRWAGLGNRGDGMAPTSTTMFEIGSITKLFTGLLLADAVDHGVVRLKDTVDMYLPPLVGSAAGSATLEELATHRSGLPAYADEEAGATYEGAGTSDVETITQEAVIEEAAELTLSERGTYAYSNLGFALLGYALARAEGAPSWTSLVTQRVLRPAGMTHTVFVPSKADVPAAAALGSLPDGQFAPYSVGPSYFPAGTATFSTLDDLASFARWVINGSAIGRSALNPLYEISPVDSIGLAWMITTTTTGVSVWHDGSVPGFSSILGFDLARRRAVAVLSNTGATVDPLGMKLLEPRSPVAGPSAPGYVRAIAALACVLAVACVLFAARRGRRLVGVAVAFAAQTGLVLAVDYLPWQNLPGWSWALASGSVSAAMILGVDEGPRSPRQLVLPVVAGVLSGFAFYALTVRLAG